MGHTVGEQAGRSVKKSEKTKLAERTPQEIIKSIRNLLDAKLAVTPDDTRFLLTKYDEAIVLGEALVASKWVDAVPLAHYDDLQAKYDRAYAALQAMAPTMAETPVEEFMGAENKLAEVVELVNDSMGVDAAAMENEGGPDAPTS
jgi:hypothetical protein